MPGGHGRRLAVALALLAACLIQTGCQSGPFSPCGFVGRTTSRILRPFQRDRNACCGPEVIADGCAGGLPVEGVVAGTAVVPAPVITPAPQVGAPVTVPPADSPTNLEPIAPESRPESRPGPAPGSTRRLPSGTGSRAPSNYDSQRPDLRSTQSRGENLAQTLVSTPVPAARPAQAGPRAGDHTALDNLPPLDLPGEVTEKTATPPVAPAVERKPQSPATAGDPLGGRSPREPDLVPAASAPAASPATDPTSTAAPVPGIARFVAVDLKLAGGSAPSTAGLDWLAEKGYKTLLDLRPTADVDASFISEATRRGLRYIPLPVDSSTFEPEHLARFNFELSSGDARPLYFFDAAGARAGALWYIRRITVDQVTSQVARREALDLGCISGDDWLAATSYLDRLERPRSQDRSAAAVPAAVSNRSRPGL